MAIARKEILLSHLSGSANNLYSLIKEKDLWNNNFAVLFLGKEARLDLSPLLYFLSQRLRFLPDAQPSSRDFRDVPPSEPLPFPQSFFHSLFPPDHLLQNPADPHLLHGYRLRFPLRRDDEEKIPQRCGSGPECHLSGNRSPSSPLPFPSGCRQILERRHS